MNGTLAAVLLAAVIVTALMAALAWWGARASARRLDRAIEVAARKERRTGRCGVCDGTGTGTVGRAGRTVPCWRCRGAGTPPGKAVPSRGDG